MAHLDDELLPPTGGGPSGTPGAPPPRVVLYVRAGCHLCAAAREVVAGVCAERGEPWAEVDVDAAPEVRVGPRGLPAAEAYGELVPVVEVDGVRQGYWQIDAARLGRAIGAEPVPRPTRSRL